jgi:Ca-activated chloride channel family protein
MSFQHPHFAEPSWLWLAVLGPILLFALQRYSAQMRKRQLARVATAEVLGELTASHSPLRRTFKEVLALLAVGGIGLALARPQWGEYENAGQLLGEDMVFLLDCSRSMLATDITPTRLERARLAIMNYIQSRGRGRVGLVAFAGQAFLQCPLTYDYNAFQDALASIDDKTIPVPGTDIGRAIDEGFQAMDKADGHKILVLLTDGEDLEKAGIRVAEKLREEGVVVYTLGVGTPAGAEIQMVNEQGQTVLLRDAKGQVVRSRLDEATLKNIAQVTGGRYYSLGPLGEGLARVRLAVDALEQTGPAAPGKRAGVDRFHFVLAGVLLLLIVESLIGTRRRLREVGTA